MVEDELQGGTLLDPASVTGPDPLNTSVSGTLNISGGTITGLGYNGALGSATQAGLTWAANDGSWTMTITNAASGAFTFTLLGPLDHPLAGLVFGDDTLTGLFAATITGEGGTITRDITITVNDDGPTVTSNATVQLDDDALSGGNPGGVGDDPDAVNVTGTLGHSFGADGGSIALSDQRRAARLQLSNFGQFVAGDTGRDDGPDADAEHRHWRLHGDPERADQP